MTSCRAPVLSRVARLLLSFALPALLLASGCQSTQREARQESLDRWNRVRADVKAKLASDQLAAGHVEDAATELTDALRLDPSNPKLLTLQARVCLARGDHATAERLLEGIEAEGKLTAEVEYLRGTIEQQRLHWDEALNYFVRAASEDPQEVAYVVAIADSMLQLGQTEGARDFLLSHEDKFGWTSAYHCAMAECCEQLGDWDSAVAAWERVVDADDIPSVRERLALALYHSGRCNDAIPHLERLLEDDTSESLGPLRLALAQCLVETGRPAAAREQLSRLLREDSQNVSALQVLACAYAAEGTLDRARRTAEQALRIDPDNPQTLELAAALAFKTGDQARAVALAEQILTLAPETSSPVASEILGQLASSPTTED
jgi:tetratricopeptide (TPR) repeat protein